MHKAVKTAIAAAALSAAFFAGAHHAHAATPAKEPAVVMNTYDGIFLGVDANALDFDGVAQSTHTKFDVGGNARLGYLKQYSDGYVVGAEVLDGTNGSVARSTVDKQTVGNDFAADLRGGKVVAGNLLYGKVGYALTDIQSSNFVDDSHNSATFSGVRMGGGVERYLTDKIVGRGEVIYTDYQARTLDSVSVDPSNVAVKVGVSYKLD